MKQRRYLIETFGCQMNVHDSERMAGLLEQAGYERADGDGDRVDEIARMIGGTALTEAVRRTAEDLLTVPREAKAKGESERRKRPQNAQKTPGPQKSQKAPGPQKAQRQ